MIQNYILALTNAPHSQHAIEASYRTRLEHERKGDFAATRPAYAMITAANSASYLLNLDRFAWAEGFYQAIPRSPETWRTAVISYERAVRGLHEEHPLTVAANCRIGEVYRHVGKHHKSMDSFGKALRSAPNGPNAQVFLESSMTAIAFVYAQSEDPHAACGYIHRHLAGWSRRATLDLLARIAAAYTAIGKRREATIVYELLVDHERTPKYCSYVSMLRALRREQS